MTQAEENATVEDVPAPAEPGAVAGPKPVKDRVARRWLVVLTVLVALLLAAQCCGVASIVVDYGFFDEMMRSQDESSDESASIERDIRTAYGTDVESVSVRSVKVSYGAPFPFSMADGSNERAYAVEYRIRGIDVTCANVMPDASMGMPVPGLVPPKSAMSDRMEAAQFKVLLAAYGKVSDAPFGGLARYTSDSMMMDSGSLPATLTIGDEGYATSRLWSVVEGRHVEGDSFDAGGDVGVQAAIFYEDPEAGTFEYLGTEPYQGFIGW